MRDEHRRVCDDSDGCDDCRAFDAFDAVRVLAAFAVVVNLEDYAGLGIEGLDALARLAPCAGVDLQAYERRSA